MLISDLEQRMSWDEYVTWQAIYKYEHELRTDTVPPLEYDSADDQAAAIDRMFK